MFGNNERFKRTVAVTGNRYLGCTIVVQNHRLFTIPVAAVAAMIPCIVVLFVAEVFIHFSIQNTLIESTCQLPYDEGE